MAPNRWPEPRLSEMTQHRPTLLAVTAGTWRTASDALREDDYERERLVPSIEIQTCWRALAVAIVREDLYHHPIHERGAPRKRKKQSA